jgi:hypothetical protein
MRVEGRIDEITSVRFVREPFPNGSKQSTSDEETQDVSESFSPCSYIPGSVQIIL